MKKYLLVAAAFFLTAAAADTPPTASKLLPLPRARTGFFTDRVLVHMKKSNSASAQSTETMKTRVSQIEKLSSRSSLSIQKHIPLGREDYAILNVDEKQDNIDAVIARLQGDPDVESAQPDFIYTATAVPNDTNYGQLWGLKNTGQTIAADHVTQSLYATGNPGTTGRDMGLETAWDKVTDCSAVIVAVVDTGMKLNHDDLKDNLWTSSGGFHGHDYINGDDDPTDDNGHGTHVSGTIGARGNNGIGTTGICWRVQLMAVKVLGADGSGSTSSVISGIQYAVSNGAHIINMSLGGNNFDSAYQNAVDAAGAAGVLLVVAAGNDGANVDQVPSYPCSFQTANLICVGAVDQRFGIASFSNYSTTTVDIGAPGTNILSGARSLWAATQTLPLDASSWTGNNANFAANSSYVQNPAAWDGVSANYAASTVDQIYTTFSMSGFVGGSLYFEFQGSSEADKDIVNFYTATGSSSPMATPNLVTAWSGATGGVVRGIFDVKKCAGLASCSFGLELTSNATVQDIGFRFQNLKLDPLVSSTIGLNSLNGTSMATPHVAGLAALVKAYNPLFTAADIKKAILTTGTRLTALNTKFATGSVANAPNALKYIDAPATVTATVAP